MPDWSLADLLAAAIVAALNLYLLLGGADFGGGVWDLLARGPRGERQRRVIAEAIGPIWEANHVWVILALVLLFTCFPTAFALLSVRLHLPLTALLFGIVLRGSAFVFRSYGGGSATADRRWGRLFAIASLVAPFWLGVVVGAMAAGLPSSPAPDFVANYVAPWLTPFAAATGVLTVVCCAFLAATYLTLERPDPDLRDAFRARALVAGIILFPSAWLTLWLARDAAPDLFHGLLRTGWAAALHALTAAAALGALVALWRRRFAWARAAAALQVSCLIWGWALAQYPYVVPPNLTVAEAAAPAITLRLTLAALLLGLVVLVPALRYLFRVFKGHTLTPQ